MIRRDHVFNFATLGANDFNAKLAKNEPEPPHLPIFKVREGGSLVSSCTGSNPTAMLTTPPIPYFSDRRKLPHMGCFSPSQKGKELEFSPNSNGRRVANF